MSDGSGTGSASLGQYQFLAWARQGLVATLTNPDNGGTLPVRASSAVALTVSAMGATPVSDQVPAITVETFGPGDVIGIDPRHVVRTEPRDSTTNFEPNYLAAIEFDTPDFPWLFTPAGPAGDRLRPWLVLIALKPAEYSVVPGVPQPLPAIDVTGLAGLQPLDDSWNWAHVQVAGTAGLAATLASQPAAVISRLLCPRRLDPETTYTAFVVPAFEAGRQAGLGLDVDSLTTTGPAWTSSTTAPLRLPVYYQFQFYTSDQGDFESLVRALTPVTLGPGIGQRPMAVDDPSGSFPSGGAPLGLPGALQSLATQTTAWPDPDKTSFQTAMQALVTRMQPVADNPSGPDPQVVPPLYGAWQAGTFTVTPGGTGWLDELSLDPRNRTAAGLGTQVVQAGLTALLASAWQQVAGIEQANALLRGAQLARGVLSQLHAGLAAATTDTQLTLTTPLHAQLLAGPAAASGTAASTVRAAIGASRLPALLLSPAARRLTSPVSAIRRRQVSLGGVPGSLVGRINANTATIVPPPATPPGLVSIEGMGAAPPVSPTGPPVVSPPVPPTVSPVGPPAATPSVLPISVVVRMSLFTRQAITLVPPHPDFATTVPPTALPVPAVTLPVAGTADSAQAALFRSALAPLADAWQAAAPDPTLAPALDAAQLSQTILAKLDPAVTVPARALSMITVASGLAWHPADPIRTIMAAPAFPQPTYAPLAGLSPQYVLPGVDQVPANSVGLVQADHAFIEAYMVGLSHEMARQLLWVGYPTDGMGTYFRQFWDVSKYVPVPTDPTNPAQLAELLLDIPPINTWPLALGLGSHDNRTGVPPDNIALLIRGDLLRRYPDAIIYAAKAKLANGQRVIDTTDERYPIYAGSLPGDITFIGFNLSPADAQGGTTAAPEGFFFVFQQHPSGPRFGLEPSAAGTVTQWSDLAWTNFATTTVTTTVTTTAGAASRPAVTPVLAEPDYLPPWAPWRLPSAVFTTVLGQVSLPSFLSASAAPQNVQLASTGTSDAQNTWGADAAQTAYITLRLPFRIAIHASLMVPS
jgi:hypothetical protein